ncbi:NADPH-dependent FMN reductase [Bacillus cereus group sp. BfR-BA-01380]|uniref:NADPH-dependent FMN reductase n=1 Tax=Bacillus cereus group sp. BfR-BA-01380 TaxID=2920324 RepID=UPI001F5AD895|nr:NADPH-dependent FMN reductase [Bacillus cereus group sp. BfR-BA-01380]
MKALIISGSLAIPSHTYSLLKETEKYLKEKGCSVVFYDLKTNKLPECDPKYHHNPKANPDEKVVEFIKLAEEADFIIWGTPNYHNSYSGVLKSALDHLNFDQLSNKPIGLMCNSGGIRNVQPLDHLRIVARGFLGIAIPIQVATRNADYQLINDEYHLIDEGIRQRLEAFVEQLIDFNAMLKLKSLS